MIVNIIFDLFLISWEVLCNKLLVGIFSNGKRQNKRFINILATIALIVIEYSIASTLKDFLILKLLLITLVSATVMCLFYKDRWLRLLILTVFYQGVGVLSDYVAIVVLGRLFTGVIDAFSTSSIVFMLVSIICKIILFVAILLIKRIAGSNSVNMMTDMEWMKLLIVPIITMASIIAIVQRYDILEDWNQDKVLLYIAIGLAGMNINVFYLVDDILDREKKVREGQLYREKVKNETAWYYAISENLGKQRQKAHEFKNHATCIATLIQRKEFSKVEEYLKKLDYDMTQEMDMVDTNHVIINAIINTKFKEIRYKGIVFVLKVNDLSGLWLEDKDIVVLLTNLLSNAVESCESNKEYKVIKLKIVIEDGQLIVASTNSISHPPAKDGGFFKTNKSEALMEHGFGIRNIIEVVDKYDGQYAIDYDDQEFLFSIIIPQKQG